MPTPEENGKLVLNVYANLKGRPGHTLGANNFVAFAGRRRVPISDLQDGIHYATKQHWIEESQNGLRLTEDGYQAITHNVE